MIKADIVNKVAETSEISRVKAAQAVDTVIEGLRNALARGQRIELRGLSAEDISEELKKFRASAGNKPALKEYLDSIPSYGVSELVSYITAGNVGDINDLAFYLSENGRAYDAIPILQEIAKEFPDRIVAKLNLADAYWDNGFKEQASPFYKEYFDKMIARGLKSRVPSRVIERAKK